MFFKTLTCFMYIHVDINVLSFCGREICVFNVSITRHYIFSLYLWLLPYSYTKNEFIIIFFNRNKFNNNSFKSFNNSSISLRRDSPDYTILES